MNGDHIYMIIVLGFILLACAVYAWRDKGSRYIVVTTKWGTSYVIMGYTHEEATDILKRIRASKEDTDETRDQIRKSAPSN